MTPNLLSKAVGIRPMTALPCRHQSPRRANPMGHPLICLKVLYHRLNAIIAAHHHLSLVVNLKVGVANPEGAKDNLRVNRM